MNFSLKDWNQHEKKIENHTIVFVKWELREREKTLIFLYFSCIRDLYSLVESIHFCVCPMKNYIVRWIFHWSKYAFSVRKSAVSTDSIQIINYWKQNRKHSNRINFEAWPLCGGGKKSLLRSIKVTTNDLYPVRQLFKLFSNSLYLSCMCVVARALFGTNFWKWTVLTASERVRARKTNGKMYCKSIVWNSD